MIKNTLTDLNKMLVFITDENPMHKVTTDQTLLSLIDWTFTKKPKIDEITGVYQGKAEKSYMLTFEVTRITELMSITDICIELGKMLGQDSILTFHDVAGNILYKCQTGIIDAFGHGYELADSPEKLSDTMAYSVISPTEYLRVNLV